MKILIVDDSLVMTKILKKAIQKIDTQTVVIDICNSVKQALEMLASEDYNLLITDLIMPDITGIQLIKKLREESNHMDIFVFTSTTSKEIMDELELLGSQTCYEKTI